MADHTDYPKLSHSQRKATCSCGRTTEPSAISATLVSSCWKQQTPAIISRRDHCRREASFRAGRGTTEQPFNLRIVCEKYLQHQQNLYHVFTNFKKADRVWHQALWATMRKYINANIIRIIEICMTRPRVQSFSMAAHETGSELQSVWQECLLSPTLWHLLCHNLRLPPLHISSSFYFLLLFHLFFGLFVFLHCFWDLVTFTQIIEAIRER